jgi:hypothetical protein
VSVTPAGGQPDAARRDVAVRCRRLRALTAIGHSAVSPAVHAGVAVYTIRQLLDGSARTPALHQAVAAMHAELWDKPLAEDTGARRRAAASGTGARRKERLAAVGGTGR